MECHVRINDIQDTAQLLGGSKMVKHLTRNCPKCGGYLSIVMREPGMNVPLRAVNGRCLVCCFQMAWIVIRGKKKRRYRRRKTGPVRSRERNTIFTPVDAREKI
jgi:hypothetical protein